MGEEFYKFKRRFTVAATLKSAAVGVACGLFAVGAVLLALKLSSVAISAGYYVLIGAASALVVGAGVFWIYRPTDEKVAKKLDCEYGLHERVRTALKYQNSSGGLYELQREDTQAVLSSLEFKKPTFGKIWQYVLICVLSLTLTVTAAALPASIVVNGEGTKPSPPAWGELPFEVSEFQILRIEGLIEDVESLELGESLKASVTTALGNLITELRAAESNGDMSIAIGAAVRGIDNSCKAEASYYKIGSSLKGLGRADLAKVIAAGAETYRGYTFTDVKSVRDYYADRLEITDRATEGPLQKFGETVGKAFIGSRDDASAITNGIHLGIILSNVSAGDGLYLLINELTLSLDALMPEDTAVYDGEEEELTPEQNATLSKVNAVLEYFGYDLSDLLASQAFGFAADKYIYTALCDIFALDADISIGYNLSDQTGGDAEDGDGKNNSGGYGDGKTEYGSDDLIYDPDTGEYVPYGKIINKYYAIVNELLLSGKLTEEQANIIRTYFEMLLSGIKEGAQ